MSAGLVVLTKCPRCGGLFAARRPGGFCSDTCRQRALRDERPRHGRVTR